MYDFMRIQIAIYYNLSLIGIHKQFIKLWDHKKYKKRFTNCLLYY